VRYASTSRVTEGSTVTARQGFPPDEGSFPSWTSSRDLAPPQTWVGNTGSLHIVDSVLGTRDLPLQSLAADSSFAPTEVDGRGAPVPVSRRKGPCPAGCPVEPALAELV
jgi:hypothetical protein